MCFPVIFLKSLKTPILQNISKRIFTAFVLSSVPNFEFSHFVTKNPGFKKLFLQFLCRRLYAEILTKKTKFLRTREI